MIIPEEFQPFAWYVAMALISTGGSIIAAGCITVGKQLLARLGTLEKDSKYLMTEDLLEKDRRVGGGDRRKRPA